MKPFLEAGLGFRESGQPSCAPTHVDSDQEYFRSLTAAFLSLPPCRMIGKAYLTKERSECYPLLGRWTELFRTPVDLSLGTCGAVVAAGKMMPGEEMDVGGNV